ncbi:MAG: ComF family protein [Nanoarchaeota archaeon]
MLISKLEFGSFLTYCPRRDGANDEIKKSRNLMINLKNEQSINNRFMSELIAERIKENISNLPFKDLFNKNVSLVPVPKSSLMTTDALWVPYRIAKELEKIDLGTLFPCLERIKAVPRSSHSKPEDRPRPIDHYHSIKVKSLVHQPKKIMLVDDIITRGSTLIGCSSVLRERYPQVPIFAFAVIRTISNSQDFIAINRPCMGVINLSNGETFRNP